MAFTVRRFLSAPVSDCANAGRASVTSGGVVASPLALVDGGASGNAARAGRASATGPDIDVSPRMLVGRCAAVNGAVRKLTANFLSPRFPRNVSLWRAAIGRAIMEVSARVGATRGVRYQLATAAGWVTVLASVGG